MPRQSWPAGLVPPVRIDPAGVTGPTRGAAYGPGWRRVRPGWFVPVGVDPTPEQRVLEAATALPRGFALTGWAALRLLGGGFFDGRDRGGPLDVPVLVPHGTHPRPVPGARWVYDVLPAATGRVHGLPCVAPERAVLDAMRLAGSDREAVVVMDMAAAAEITSIARVRAALAREPRRQGAARVRWALDHAAERSRSPQETHLRLVWTLDAGLPPPLLNRGVRARGRLLGVPDLLDPEAGVAGEYDGALHRDRDRHRADNRRHSDFRDVGLETFTVVAGDPVSVQVARMRAARERAAARPPGPRAWELAPDEGPDLDARLALRERRSERRRRPRRSA